MVDARKDICFFIKFFPLSMHKEAYRKSKSIACAASASEALKLLEDNFERKPIPLNECATKEIDDTIRLAQSLEITGTPTLIFPDGKVQSGALPSGKIIEYVDGRE